MQPDLLYKIYILSCHHNTYYLISFLVSLIDFLSKYLYSIAFVGHMLLQRPQRIHSKSLEFLTGSTFILHAFEQAWQLMHFSVLT